MALEPSLCLPRWSPLLHLPLVFSVFSSFSVFFLLRQLFLSVTALLGLPCPFPLASFVCSPLPAFLLPLGPLFCLLCSLPGSSWPPPAFLLVAPLSFFPAAVYPRDSFLLLLLPAFLPESLTVPALSASPPVSLVGVAAPFSPARFDSLSTRTALQPFSLSAITLADVTGSACSYRSISCPARWLTPSPPCPPSSVLATSFTTHDHLFFSPLG